MEKRTAPFKVSEAESSQAILKSPEHSHNEKLGLLTIPEVESEKSLPETIATKASTTTDPLEPAVSDLTAAASANIIPKHHGLTRHRAIVGGCLLIAAFAFGLSSFDFSSLIKRKATLGKTGSLVYATQSPKLPNGMHYGRSSLESEGLRLVETSYIPRREGFADLSGKIVIEPRFKWLGSFHDSLARASESETRLKGFIDTKGHFVIAPKYDQVRDFENGTAVVNHASEWHVIDKLGKSIGDSYEEEEPYRNGDLFVVKKYGRFGLLSNRGESLLSPTYESIIPLDGRQIGAAVGWSTFEQLRPADYFRISTGGLTGVIDRKGQVVLKPEFESVESYSNGFAVITKGGQSELIDPSGNSLARYSELTNWDKLIAAKDNGKWFFLNAKGQKLPLQPVDSVALSPNGKWFSNGLAPVRLNGKWGFVDRRGSFAIKPQFDFVKGFEDGLCPVWDGGTWKLIDRTGAYCPLPNLGSIERMKDGLLHVEVAGPLYQFGEAETILGTRNKIQTVHSGMKEGLTLPSAFDTMRQMTYDRWNDYDGDY